MSAGIFVTDVTALPVGAAEPRALPAVRAHQLDWYDKIVGAGLLLFLFFFFLSATLQRFGVPARMEDVVFVMLTPFAYRYLPTKKNILFWLIFAYFTMSVFPYLAAFIARDYTLGIFPPVVIAKEVEYFYIAFLICQNRSWWVLHAIDAFCGVTVLYGAYLLRHGVVDYYGIGSLATVESPSMAGAMYLFTTIWLHIRLRLLPSRWMRLMALGLVALGALCVVVTVSRSSIGAMLVYIGVYMVLSLNIVGLAALFGALRVAPALIKMAAAYAAAASASAANAATGLADIAIRLLNRWSAGNLSTSGADRAGKWRYYLDLLELPEWIVGKGKAFPNALDGTFGMGVDSQYVRTLLEQGLIGVILLTAIVIRMLYAIHLKKGEWRHAYATIAAMLVMSLPMEAFQVSKSGAWFWLIMFYLYFCQRRVVGTAAISAPAATPIAP